MNRIRILIADDHTLLRNALAELLQSEEDFEVVAGAADASEMIRMAEETVPHIVLMDLEMPGNGHPPAVVRRLRERVPTARVLILSMHDSPALVQSLLPLGIRGFLHKTVTHQALTAAVRDACAPGSHVTLSLSAESLAAPHAADGGDDVLSARERQVIELAARGMSNQQIARRLEIVEATVKRHMRNIFDKLEARSRVEAANKAVERGLISSPVAAARSAHTPIPIPPPTGSTAPVM